MHRKKTSQFMKMDCRIKPGNDEWIGGSHLLLV